MLLHPKLHPLLTSTNDLASPIIQLIYHLSIDTKHFPICPDPSPSHRRAPLGSCKAIYARLTDCISLTTTCSRQHSDILSFFAVTGGLLWVLRSRSMVRKPLEQKQEKTEVATKRENSSIFGRSVEERESHSRG